MAINPLIDNLLQPGTYPHPTRDIQLVETHCAWVLLTGDTVYKIKKPVNFGFLDFSTLEKRQFFCEEEVRLNSRFAPQIYLDVVAITGSPQQPEIGGAGEPFEYAVRMRQFAGDRLLSDLAAVAALEDGHIDQLIECIGAFHKRAPRAAPGDGFGEPADIHHWVMENYHHILPLLTPADDRGRVERLADWSEKEFRRLRSRLTERHDGGAIRECHGDLHLGNITVIDGRVTPFDSIEFNPQLRWIDVLSEVAFLLMDLDDRGQTRLGWRFLNGYLQHTGDYAGLEVLRYYLVYRAMVRAKVAVLRRAQLEAEAPQYAALTAEYRQYLQLAESYLTPRPAGLVITHGLSGSGKSTLAAQVCERLGMIQLRSDVERKRLAGMAALDSSRSATGSGLYSADRTAATYARLAQLAESVLAAGFSVLVDATFLERAHRAHFLKLADSLGATALILDCQASDAELERRVLQRAASGRDASEATLEVLHAQQRQREPLVDSELSRTLRIDTSRLSGAAVESALRAALDQAAGDA